MTGKLLQFLILILINEVEEHSFLSPSTVENILSLCIK